MKLVPIDSIIRTSNQKHLMDKVVDCVKEIRSPIAPTLVMWSGETEDGYFHAAMVGGTVMMNFAEREYQVKFGLVEGVYVGGLEFILSSLVKMETNLDLTSYITDIDVLLRLAEDTKKVRFEDVMDLLNWKFKNENIQVEKPEFIIT